LAGHKAVLTLCEARSVHVAPHHTRGKGLNAIPCRPSSRRELFALQELMKEFLEREKKKQAEREAAKAARAAAPQPTGAAA
jgi:hypothetical protein